MVYLLLIPAAFRLVLLWACWERWRDFNDAHY